MTELDDFRSLGLCEETLESIRTKGFETPSPIQRLTIPVLLADQNDIIGQAQTGTGKTAAYSLPILEHVEPQAGFVQALVLVPTRELALQVTDEMLSFKRGKTVISAIYGGASMGEQLRRLKKGVDIVVGTPGRILDHLRRQTLDLSKLRYLILDEADEMLNMGFIDDVDEILSCADDNRRLLLFSATMPRRISELASKYMRDVQHLKVEATNLTADLTDQIYFEVRESDKFDALTRIIDVEPEFYAIVFCRTKVMVDEVVTKLLERGYAADGLHGDVSQAQREKILRKFKKKLTNIMVATDVAARGIDVNNLTHVINYSLPQDSESYVHRIGRTGRAGNKGTAITFISNAEYRQFVSMRKAVGSEIRKEMIPSVEDIIALKKRNILDELSEAVETGVFDGYEEMTDEILFMYEPRTAISALLKMAFKNELDTNRYPEIRTFSVDRKGTARLFIAVGRRDGFTPRSIVELIQSHTGLPNARINDVKITDDFSFVTIPFSEAENVTHALNKLSDDGKPIAEISQDKKGKGSFKGGPKRGKGGFKKRSKGNFNDDRKGDAHDSNGKFYDIFVNNTADKKSGYPKKGKEKTRKDKIKERPERKSGRHL